MHKEYYTLITGASEGFGKALALECAGRGMNLVLVALPGDELFQLGQFIENEFLVKTVCLPHDLTRKEECHSLLQEIKEKNLAVNMLINNAGIGGTHLFKERDIEFYQRQIELNVTAPTLLTHLFLEILQQNSPAHILNVSSLAGFFHLPNKQVYGGTKSYLLSFSKSLRRELKQKNVFVSTVCPGGMNTTLAIIMQNRGLNGISRWSVMNPEDVATISIEQMLQGKEVIIPGNWNRFFLFLNKLLPEKVKQWLLDYRMAKDAGSSLHKRGDDQNHLKRKPLILTSTKTAHMKKMSRWGRHHPRTTRIIITLIWVLLTGLAIYIGTTLARMNIELPQAVFIILTTLFLFTIVAYPFLFQKRKSNAAAFYIKQKSCDLLVAVSSFGMVLYAANQPGILFKGYGDLHATVHTSSSLPKDSVAKPYKTIKEFSAAMKDDDGNMLKWKERKKILKQQVKAIKKDPGTSNGEKTLLVILSVLVALGLLVLVGALACNLSCNGADAAAVLVGVGGAGLVVFLLIIAIRAIYGKQKKRKTVPDPGN